MRLGWIALAPASLASAQPASVADLVRLNDGSFYRGTITESTDDRVLLQMPSGGAHTFARADVASAGPETPPVAEPEAAPPTPTTHLHAQTHGADLMLTRVAGRMNAARMGAYWSVHIVAVDRFEPICTLPCDVDVPAGAVSRSLGPTQRAGDPIALDAGDLQLAVHYEDRQAIRIVGILTAILGGAGGYALLNIGWLFDHGPGQYNVPEMIAGGCIAAVGLALGLNDRSRFWDRIVDGHLASRRMSRRTEG